GRFNQAQPLHRKLMDSSDAGVPSKDDDAIHLRSREAIEASPRHVECPVAKRIGRLAWRRRSCREFQCSIECKTAEAQLRRFLEVPYDDRVLGANDARRSAGR